MEDTSEEEGRAPDRKPSVRKPRRDTRRFSRRFREYFSSLILGAAGFLDRFENMAFDLRARLFAPAERGDGRIALVYLDQYSLDWAQKELDVTWPWPREMYGLVAEFCARARSTTFDVLFSGPSSYGVDDDRSFAEAIAKAGNVVLSELPPGGAALSPELAAAQAPEGSVVLKPDRDGVFRRYLPFADDMKRV